MANFLMSKKFSKKYFWKYLNLLELLLSQNGRVTDAVVILSNDGDKVIQKASTRVQSNLKIGLSISEALAETFIIPNEKIISIFKAGEESAALEKALHALTQDHKKTEERNRRLIDLLIYPSIVFLFSVLAIKIPNQKKLFMHLVVLFGVAIFLGGLDVLRSLDNLFDNYWADLSKLMLLVTGFCFTVINVKSFIFIRKNKN